MAVSFKLENQSAGVVKINADFKSYILNYPCENQTICTPYIVTLSRNKYKFELWGAEGGCNGGKGGYTTGTLRIKEDTIMYFYIGAKGPEITLKIDHTLPAYNGGGLAATGEIQRSAGSGGGGTDIRVQGNSMNHRILVAGAGGGGSEALDVNLKFYGAAGGGLVGKTSTGTNYPASGATQEGPGLGTEQYGGSSNYSTHSGIFGYGGYGTSLGSHGGGGGGWFGGAGGAPNAHSGGGGGSGYILTSESYHPLNYEHNFSTQFYFTNGKTLDGESPFRDCRTNKIVNGNTGNGCAKITVLLPFTFNCRKLPFYLNSSLILLCILFDK